MAKKLNPLLAKVIEKLHKDFSKDSLITVGLSKEHVEVVPSGIFSIDLAIGIGGWPRGRIVEIYGPESSGKTSIAMSGLKAYQTWQDQLPASHTHKNRMALVVDVEHSLVGSFFKSMGIDMQRVLYAKADSVEEAFQSMLDLTKTEQIGYTFLDSIDALQNERMLQRDIGEADMGGISKDTSRFFREYSKVCENTDTIAIFLNQLRHNPGKAYGNPEVTTGGSALKFYASIRLKTMEQKPSTEVPNAFAGRVKIIKNKCSPPIATEINYNFVYAKGVDIVTDLIANAKNLGILRFAGRSTISTIAGETKTLWSEGGREGFIANLRADPEMFKLIENACYQADKEIAGTINDDLDDVKSTAIADSPVDSIS